MVDRASVGAIFAAVVEHRATEGPEAELQKHLGLSGNQIPLRNAGRASGCDPSTGRCRSHPERRLSLAFSRRAQALSWAWTMPTVPTGDAVFPDP